MNSIFDLLDFPTRHTYDIKDVDLIFITENGEDVKSLLVYGEPRFHETELKPWIDEGKLFYEQRRSSEVHDGTLQEN